MSIPAKTRNNGSLHVHIFVYPRGESPFSSSFMSYGYSLQTAYSVKLATAYKLIGDEAPEVCIAIVATYNARHVLIRRTSVYVTQWLLADLSQISFVLDDMSQKRSDMYQNIWMICHTFC